MAWTYGDSERLERVRRRAARQKRIAAASLLAFLALLAFGVWWLGASSAPPPPPLTVSWPSPEKFGTRVFNVSPQDAQSDFVAATLVARRGQPFSIQVGDAPMSSAASAEEKTGESQNWVIHAVSEDTDSKGASLRWSPAKNGATLKIFCRPVAHGMKNLVSWLWPTYVLRLRAMVPELLFDGRLQVKAPEDIAWVSSDVVVKSEVAWDDRVVPLLQAVTRKFSPEDDGSPASAHWLIASAFGQKRAPGDTATYPRIRDAQSMETSVIPLITRRARFFASQAPTASIKFVNVSGNLTTYRLAFDGKAARDGWIKKEGSPATPLRWWDANLGQSEFGSETVAPSLPRER